MTRPLIRVRMPDEALDDEDPYRLCWQGEPFYGIAEHRFESGAIQFESEYRFGRQDGVGRTYWPDGAVRRETWHDNGARLRERVWDQQGNPLEDLMLDAKGIVRHDVWTADGSVKQATRRPAHDNAVMRVAGAVAGLLGRPADAVGLVRGVRIPAMQIDFAGDRVARLDGAPFSGVTEDRDASGALRAESEFCRGVLDGLYREYDRGTIIRERWFDRGTLLRERSWYAGGQAREDRVIDADGIRSDFSWSADGTSERTFNRGSKD